MPHLKIVAPEQKYIDVKKTKVHNNDSKFEFRQIYIKPQELEIEQTSHQSKQSIAFTSKSVLCLVLLI